MERFSARMLESVAVEMHFTLSGADRQGRSIVPMEGMIYRQGDDYAMLNESVEVYAYKDTKWLYTVDNDEVIIMPHDPATTDLLENPLALFSTQLTKEYTILPRPNSFTDKGQEIVEITLSPIGKNTPYSSILLRINNKTFFPHSVKYIAKDNSWFEAVITKYTTIDQPFPPERFVFSSEKHPGVYVIDLR